MHEREAYDIVMGLLPQMTVLGDLLEANAKF